MTEFYQMCMTNKAVTEGGLEYARTVLEKAYGEQAAEDLLNVKGIGEAKLEGFRAEITFTEEDGDENSGG